MGVPPKAKVERKKKRVIDEGEKTDKKKTT